MSRYSSYEVCPWNERFAQMAAERDHAAREAREVEWDPDPAEDEALTEATIPTTDGPALVDLMKMSEDEWDAWTRGSAMRRAGSDSSVQAAVGELVAALSDDDPAVAAAAWGLGRGQGEPRGVSIPRSVAEPPFELQLPQPVGILLSEARPESERVAECLPHASPQLSAPS